MGTYLDRSMQTFMEQQGQFRQQMGSMLGQTPWSMMNQLTARHMEMWKYFQENMVAGMGRNPNASAAPPTGTDKDAAQGGNQRSPGGSTLDKRTTPVPCGTGRIPSPLYGSVTTPRRPTPP